MSVVLLLETHFKSIMKGMIKMKKSYLSMLCAFLSVTVLFSLSACADDPSPETTAVPDTGNAQIANPIVEYQTLSEMWDVLDLTSGTPAKLPQGYEQSGIMTINKEIAQVIYKSGENVIAFRAAKGSDDISGDYNTYGSIRTLKIGDLEVTAKGTDDIIQTAIWTNGGLSYSLTFSEGVSEMQLSEIIQSIS
jgi:hypothetical protein